MSAGKTKAVSVLFRAADLTKPAQWVELQLQTDDGACVADLKAVLLTATNPPCKPDDLIVTMVHEKLHNFWKIYHNDYRLSKLEPDAVGPVCVYDCPLPTRARGVAVEVIQAQLSHAAWAPRGTALPGLRYPIDPSRTATVTAWDCELFAAQCKSLMDVYQTPTITPEQNAAASTKWSELCKRTPYTLAATAMLWSELCKRNPYTLAATATQLSIALSSGGGTVRACSFPAVIELYHSRLQRYPHVALHQIVAQQLPTYGLSERVSRGDIVTPFTIASARERVAGSVCAALEERPGIVLDLARLISAYAIDLSYDVFVASKCGNELHKHVAPPSPEICAAFRFADFDREIEAEASKGSLGAPLAHSVAAILSDPEHTNLVEWGGFSLCVVWRARESAFVPETHDIENIAKRSALHIQR
jgi:hypothetical protein